MKFETSLNTIKSYLKKVQKLQYINFGTSIEVEITLLRHDTGESYFSISLWKGEAIYNTSDSYIGEQYSPQENEGTYNKILKELKDIGGKTA